VTKMQIFTATLLWKNNVISVMEDNLE